jgi:hypothetical protein
MFIYTYLLSVAWQLAIQIASPHFLFFHVADSKSTPRRSCCCKSSAAIEKHGIIIIHTHILLPRILHHRPSAISILQFIARRTVAHSYDAFDTNNKRLLCRGAVKLLQSVSTELRLDKRAAIPRTASHCTRGHILVRTPAAKEIGRDWLVCCWSVGAHSGRRILGKGKGWSSSQPQHSSNRFL